MPPRLAVFPKCFLDQMVPVPGDPPSARTLTWLQWTEMGAQVPWVSGLEAYPLALDSFDPGYLQEMRDAAAAYGLQIPMMCASPDFTQPDPEARKREIERYLRIVDATADLGGTLCRVLSGQRRPDVGHEEGIQWVVEAIEEVLPHAGSRGVTLIMENHYKDGFWQYPEFAQSVDIYLEIISRVHSPWFGVNYDPSNALIAGDDPIALLERVKDRVVSMHASDRRLVGGTLEDLRQMDADPMTGYASVIQHGVIGEGLIDYDAIFRILKGIGFEGWISIEDGQDPAVGMEHLRQSAEFLHRKLAEHELL